MIFGAGFGTAYPVYVGYVMQRRRRRASRRGVRRDPRRVRHRHRHRVDQHGLVDQRYGFPTAFGVAAALSALALPYFLAVDFMFRRRTSART